MIDRIEQRGLPPLGLSLEQMAILRYTHDWVNDFYRKTEVEQDVVVGGYGLGHSERVATMGLVIACYEGIDPYPHFISGMLHDLGRAITDDPRSRNFLHGQLSRELAQSVLDSIDLRGHSRVGIEDAIEDHPLLNHEVRNTVYVKILQDGDRLDGLSGYEPSRAGQSRWRVPVVVPHLDSSTQEGAVASVRQDLTRILEWEQMLWTGTARTLAAYATPILRQLVRESDIRTNFIYAVLSGLGVAT